VKPAYLEKELTSIATSFAPSISKIDLGISEERGGRRRKEEVVIQVLYEEEEE